MKLSAGAVAITIHSKSSYEYGAGQALMEGETLATLAVARIIDPFEQARDDHRGDMEL